MDFNKTAKMYENILQANGVTYSKIVEVYFDLEDKETTLQEIAALSSEERERRSICKFYIGFQYAGFCTHEWHSPLYDEQGDETGEDEDCYEWASVRDAVRILFCELLEDSIRPCVLLHYILEHARATDAMKELIGNMTRTKYALDALKEKQGLGQ